MPLCFCVVGALLAFLWYNAHPALVFMGDTGSLALGALLAVCAFMTGQWLLLPVIGIVFVGEAVSVILQVLYFRLTGRQAPVQDGPAAPPFRADGLVGNADHDALLAGQYARRDAGRGVGARRECEYEMRSAE